MAGSFAHIVDDNGAFTMDNIEHLGDAHEALEECFDIIALLIAEISPLGSFEAICEMANAPVPKATPQFGARAEGE